MYVLIKKRNAFLCLLIVEFQTYLRDFADKFAHIVVRLWHEPAAVGLKIVTLTQVEKGFAIGPQCALSIFKVSSGIN